jgi:hypothetical protein
MNRTDFLKLIGAHGAKAEYLPVACLLRSGYGCAGYYNAQLNDGLTDVCVLANVRLVAFRDPRPGGRGAIEDFSDFLEEVVLRSFHEAAAGAQAAEQTGVGDAMGKSVPLAAVPFDEIAVIYPVAHIGTMMRTVEAEDRRVPAFFDFDNKSIILRALRTRLW